jgi:hypothetical protein
MSLSTTLLLKVTLVPVTPFPELCCDGTAVGIAVALELWGALFLGSVTANGVAEFNDDGKLLTWPQTILAT